MADQDYIDLIDTLIAEAGGESRAGQIATAYAIANRAEKKGKTPGQIVREHKQFEGYSDPGPDARRAQKDPKVRARLEKVWEDVSTRAVPDPLNGGTMFHANGITPYWSDEENKHGTKRIGNQTYYLGSGAKPSSALAAIDAVSPAEKSSLLQGYAPSPASVDDRLNARNLTPPRILAPLPASVDDRINARNLAPSRMSTTDQIVQNSTTPQNVDQTLQAALNARFPGNAPARPDVPQSDIERGTPRANPTAKYADMPVGLPQVLPGTPTWSEFYKGVLPSSPAKPVAPNPASPDEMMLARTGVGGSRVAALPAVPPARVAGVTTELGYPYGFKAIDATLNPRPTRTVGQPAAPAPLPTIANFSPVQPPTPLPSPYNGVTSAQRNALSALPTPPRLMPSTLPDTPLTTGTLKPTQLAQIGVGLGTQVDANGRRVTVPAALDVPMPRPRPSLPSAPPARQPLPSVDLSLTSLGPVNNMLGIPNAVPRDINMPIGAPQPMPRIDRGGIFGKPKIGNFDIPLPGVFGVLQNATRAMNNASGPFNNGLDNALMQGMRGGNFTAPGAATMQAGGFLYAPKPGGGFINVGRVPTGVPQLPTSRPTISAPSFSTAIERIRDSSSQSRDGASAYSIAN